MYIFIASFSNEFDFFPLRSIDINEVSDKTELIEFVKTHSINVFNFDVGTHITQLEYLIYMLFGTDEADENKQYLYNFMCICANQKVTRFTQNSQLDKVVKAIQHKFSYADKLTLYNRIKIDTKTRYKRSKKYVEMSFNILDNISEYERYKSQETSRFPYNWIIWKLSLPDDISLIKKTFRDRSSLNISIEYFDIYSNKVRKLKIKSLAKERYVDGNFETFVSKYFWVCIDNTSTDDNLRVFVAIDPLVINTYFKLVEEERPHKIYLNYSPSKSVFQDKKFDILEEIYSKNPKKVSTSIKVSKDRFKEKSRQDGELSKMLDWLLKIRTNMNNFKSLFLAKKTVVQYNDTMFSQIYLPYVDSIYSFEEFSVRNLIQTKIVVSKDYQDDYLTQRLLINMEDENIQVQQQNVKAFLKNLSDQVCRIVVGNRDTVTETMFDHFPVAFQNFIYKVYVKAKADPASKINITEDFCKKIREYFGITQKDKRNGTMWYDLVRKFGGGKASNIPDIFKQTKIFKKLKLTIEQYESLGTHGMMIVLFPFYQLCMSYLRITTDEVVVAGRPPNYYNVIKTNLDIPDYGKMFQLVETDEPESRIYSMLHILDVFIKDKPLKPGFNLLGNKIAANDTSPILQLAANLTMVVDGHVCLDTTMNILPRIIPKSNNASSVYTDVPAFKITFKTKDFLNFEKSNEGHYSIDYAFYPLFKTLCPTQYGSGLNEDNIEDPLFVMTNILATPKIRTIKFYIRVELSQFQKTPKGGKNNNGSQNDEFEKTTNVTEMFVIELNDSEDKYKNIFSKVNGPVQKDNKIDHLITLIQNNPEILLGIKQVSSIDSSINRPIHQFRDPTLYIDASLVYSMLKKIFNKSKINENSGVAVIQSETWKSIINKYPKSLNTLTSDDFYTV